MIISDYIHHVWLHLAIRLHQHDGRVQTQQRAHVDRRAERDMLDLKWNHHIIMIRDAVQKQACSNRTIKEDGDGGSGAER